MNHASLALTLGSDASQYFVGAARLHRHRLIFNYASLNEPVCCANILACNEGLVEGALYQLPLELLEKIDRREGVHLGRYQRQAVQVEVARGRLFTATCYFGLITLAEEAAPSRRYRELLLQGWADSGVSQDYIKKMLEHMNRLPARSKG